MFFDSSVLVIIIILIEVKYHGFWYEKEKELCPNPLSSKS